MSTDTYLAWVDLETTGLTEHDHIIEVAVVLTDSSLKEITRYSSIVRPTPSTFARILDDDIVHHMHSASGLLQELEAEGDESPSLSEIEQHLISLVAHHVPADATLHIAGGGVAAFDQPRLVRKMPMLMKRFHYWPVDISLVVRAYQLASGDHSTFAKSPVKAHRALADIDEDLGLARKFWAMSQGISFDQRQAVLPHTVTDRILRAVSLADSLDRGDIRESQRVLDEQSPQDVVAGMATVAAHLAQELAAARHTTVGAVLDELRMIAARG